MSKKIMSTLAIFAIALFSAAAVYLAPKANASSFSDGIIHANTENGYSLDDHWGLINYLQNHNGITIEGSSNDIIMTIQLINEFLTYDADTAYVDQLKNALKNVSALTVKPTVTTTHTDAVEAHCSDNNYSTQEDCEAEGTGGTWILEVPSSDTSETQIYLAGLLEEFEALMFFNSGNENTIALTVNAQGANLDLGNLDGLDLEGLNVAITIKNVGNPDEVNQALQQAGIEGIQVISTSPSNSGSNGGSSYSGPTQFTNEIAAQLEGARELPVVSSANLADVQVDVTALNLQDTEPVEAFVFSEPQYVGMATKDANGIAHFNLSGLNLEAGEHTLALVTPGTNVVKAKAAFSVGASQAKEAKVSKTAGFPVEGSAALALLLVVAFAANRRRFTAL